MNIIYLGLMYDQIGLKKAKENAKSNLQMATHRFQEMLVEGISVQNDTDLSVLNILPIGSFPINYKRAVIGKKTWGDGNIRIGYINLPYIKQYMQKRALRKEIIRKLSDSDENAILMYSLHVPFVDAAFDVKRKRKDVKVYIVQTDAVAGRCGDGKGKYDSKQKTKEADHMLRRCKEMDGFILLTKHLIGPMEVGERPYIIMEGLCDLNQEASRIKTKSDNIFLYTGTVNEEYSIKEMVDAFADTPNAILWICGTGDAEDYVIEKCKSCDNIKFWGFKSGKELETIRDNCDFFINPRKPTGTYTMYSFPSKTMEYLVSGKPAVVYKLEGIPDEYDEYLNYLDTNKDMTEQVKAITEGAYDAYLDRAQRGRQFVTTKKNAIIQARRVVELMRKRNDG